MRAILKSTGERGEAWQDDSSRHWQWYFEADDDRVNRIDNRIRRNRSDLVLLPASGEGVQR